MDLFCVEFFFATRSESGHRIPKPPYTVKHYFGTVSYDSKVDRFKGIYD